MIRLSTVLFLLCVAAPPLQAATLKIATISPDGTSWMKQLRGGADEITRRTEGRVKFRFYPGGVMGNDKSVLRKIRIGQLHGGALTGNGLAQIDPDTQVYGLPFLFHSYEEVDYVRERLDPAVVEGLHEHGFVSFGIGEGGFAYLMSERPVGRIDDLKSCKVWSPDGDAISRAGLQSVGVEPIQLPMTDVLTSLQTGLVDTVGASPTAAIALQWHTEVAYLTDVPLMYLYGSLVIERRAFERLSAADQAVVKEVMTSVFQRLNGESRRDNDAARIVLQKRGIHFVVMGDKDRAWQEKVNHAMERLGAKGTFSPALYDRLRSHLTAFRGTH